jgi:hypothetical protein
MAINRNVGLKNKQYLNMHVRERHENMQREVTFYRYVLEYMAT